jgi:AraC family transcriptional regulator
MVLRPSCGSADRLARTKIYDIFHPEPSLLGQLYDGVRARNVGSHVVTMGYATSQIRSQGQELIAYGSSTLVFHRRGHRDFTFQRGRQTGLCRAGDGQVSLLPAGVAVGVHYHEACEGLVVGLSSGMISSVASELGIDGHFPLATGLDDPALSAIAESLWSIGSGSRRFLDTLGKAMLIRIFEKHADHSPPNIDSTPAWLKTTQAYIRTHLERKISLEDLAEAAGLSRAYFARSFKEATGVSPLAYVARARAERASELILAEPETKLSRVAAAVGFCDQSHLTNHFRDRFGMTPAAFRKR